MLELERAFEKSKFLVWVHGPVGCGKTSMVHHFLEKAGKDVVKSWNKSHVHHAWTKGLQSAVFRATTNPVLVLDDLEAFENFYQFQLGSLMALESPPKAPVVVVSSTERFYRSKHRKKVEPVRLFAPFPSQIVRLLSHSNKWQVAKNCNGDVRQALAMEDASSASTDLRTTMFDDASILLGEKEPPTQRWKPCDRGIRLAYDNYMGNTKEDFFENCEFIERLCDLDAAPFECKRAFEACLKRPELPFVMEATKLAFYRKERPPNASHQALCRKFRKGALSSTASFHYVRPSDSSTLPRRTTGNGSESSRSLRTHPRRENSCAGPPSFGLGTEFFLEPVEETITALWKRASGVISLFLLIVLILISILFVFLSYNNSKLQAHSRPAFDYDADFEGEDEEDSEEEENWTKSPP